MDFVLIDGDYTTAFSFFIGMVELMKYNKNNRGISIVYIFILYRIYLKNLFIVLSQISFRPGFTKYEDDVKLNIQSKHWYKMRIDILPLMFLSFYVL